MRAKAHLLIDSHWTLFDQWQQAFYQQDDSLQTENIQRGFTRLSSLTEKPMNKTISIHFLIDHPVARERWEMALSSEEGRLNSPRVSIWRRNLVFVLFVFSGTISPQIWTCFCEQKGKELRCSKLERPIVEGLLAMLQDLVVSFQPEKGIWIYRKVPIKTTGNKREIE